MKKILVFLLAAAAAISMTACANVTIEPETTTPATEATTPGTEATTPETEATTPETEATEPTTEESEAPVDDDSPIKVDGDTVSYTTYSEGLKITAKYTFRNDRVVKIEVIVDAKTEANAQSAYDLVKDGDYSCFGANAQYVKNVRIEGPLVIAEVTDEMVDAYEGFTKETIIEYFESLDDTGTGIVTTAGSANPGETSPNIKVDGDHVYFTTQTSGFDCVIDYCFKNGTVNDIKITFFLGSKELAEATMKAFESEGMKETMAKYYKNLRVEGENIVGNMSDAVIELYSGCNVETLVSALEQQGDTIGN